MQRAPCSVMGIFPSVKQFNIAFPCRELYLDSWRSRFSALAFTYLISPKAPILPGDDCDLVCVLCTVCVNLPPWEVHCYLAL